MVQDAATAVKNKGGREAASVALRAVFETGSSVQASRTDICVAKYIVILKYMPEFPVMLRVYFDDGSYGDDTPRGHYKAALQAIARVDDAHGRIARVLLRQLEGVDDLARDIISTTPTPPIVMGVLIPSKTVTHSAVAAAAPTARTPAPVSVSVDVSDDIYSACHDYSDRHDYSDDDQSVDDHFDDDQSADDHFDDDQSGDDYSDDDQSGDDYSDDDQSGDDYSDELEEALHVVSSTSSKLHKPSNVSASYFKSFESSNVSTSSGSYNVSAKSSGASVPTLKEPRATFTTRGGKKYHTYRDCHHLNGCTVQVHEKTTKKLCHSCQRRGRAIK
jgi:hypothetical protein